MREPGPRRYPTDLSDAEWSALEPLLPPQAPRGRPLTWPRRLMAEAIFYLVRSGWATRARRAAGRRAQAGVGTAAVTPEVDEA
jgi:transposase